MKVENFVPFDIAFSLRERGYNVPTEWRYDENTKKLDSWKDIYVDECINDDRAFAYKSVDRLEQNYYLRHKNDDFGYYLQAPTYEEVVEWFLDKHRINIYWVVVKNNRWYYRIQLLDNINSEDEKIIGYSGFKDFRMEVKDASIINALKLI